MKLLLFAFISCGQKTVDHGGVVTQPPAIVDAKEDIEDDAQDCPLDKYETLFKRDLEVLGKIFIGNENLGSFELGLLLGPVIYSWPEELLQSFLSKQGYRKLAQYNLGNISCEKILKDICQ